MEKKLEELKAVCADMRKEISQREQESKILKEDLENKQRQLSKDEKDLEAAKEDLEKFKVRIGVACVYRSLIAYLKTLNLI